MLTRIKITLPIRQSNFWKFCLGNLISSLGSSFTSFSLPLLVFKLTGSALDLGLAFAANMLPYLLFGLIIGAWVDRTNRRYLMIFSDLLSGLMIALLPTLYFLHWLSLGLIYLILFVNSALFICHSSASFAAIPSLVEADDLVAANGYMQTGSSLANVLGPLLAGLLFTILPLPAIFYFDALSFFISMGSLLWITTTFNRPREGTQPKTTIFGDIKFGLQYILNMQLMRWIVIMLVLVNLVVPTIFGEFVLFAKQIIKANDTQLGLLYSAGSMGVVLVGLAVGRLSKRWSFSMLALGSLMIQGILTIVLVICPWFWLQLILWALISSMSSLFNINLISLCQVIIPNQLLGRVASFVRVLTWSASPLGALLGAFLITSTKNASLVYMLLGGLAFLIPFGFMFSPIGRVGTKEQLQEVTQTQTEP